MSENPNVLERLFDEGNPYFSSFYLKFDRDGIRSFFENHDEERKYLTYFFFYVESLFCVHNTPTNVTKSNLEAAGELAHLHANKLWYATLLTILIGIVVKTAPSTAAGVICSCCGKTGNKARESFKLVMMQLDEGQRRHFINHYKGGAFRVEDFKKIAEDIYADRNYFAHDVANLETPEKDGLTYDMREDGIFIGFNIKPEEILLNIVMSLIKYWGYEKELAVCTIKKHNKLSDFI